MDRTCSRQKIANQCHFSPYSELTDHVQLIIGQLQTDM